MALHDNYLNTNRESGVAFPLFIPRLDERLWVEVWVHTVAHVCCGLPVLHMDVT